MVLHEQPSRGTAASVVVLDYEPAEDAATSVAFVDIDPTAGTIAGQAFIGRATDESSVDFYNLYFSRGSTPLALITSVPAPTLAVLPSATCDIGFATALRIPLPRLPH